MKRRALLLLVTGAAVLAAAAVLFVGRRAVSSPDTRVGYKTGIIVRGDIEESVSSNGNLKAVGTVTVLAQLTGTIEKVYVEFNDPVTKNQPLAEINTEKLRITLKEAKAAMDKAAAQAEFDSGEYEKSRLLQERKLISDSDFAAKKLSYLSSAASLEQAEASYEEARINIEKYAVVLSPITGIVLDRAVEEGETVIGSGSTNTQLFTLAENLREMEIEAAVDEMDIGSVKVGQTARFTVEAYADRTFSGKVRQIRIVPTASDNVVSYTVIVRAENVGALLPGMTATVDFLVNEKKNVVLVPSAALRFTPSDEIVAAARRTAFEERLADKTEAEREEALRLYDERTNGSAEPGSLLSGRGGQRMLGGGPGLFPPGGPGGTGKQAAEAGRRTLWLLEEGGTVSMRIVRTGASDGTNTEIIDGDALVGKAAIVRAQ